MGGGQADLIVSVVCNVAEALGWDVVLENTLLSCPWWHTNMPMEQSLGQAKPSTLDTQRGIFETAMKTSQAAVPTTRKTHVSEI